MNIKSKTIQGVFWSGIQNWGSQAGSFIVFLILARLLSPKDFGLVALANVFINFMQIFLNQGFAHALIQKQNLEEKDINTAFWTQVFVGFFLTTLTLSSANFIAFTFNQPRLTLTIQVLSILFIIASLRQTQVTLLNREFKFKVMATCSLLGIFFAGIVGILMAFWGYGVWSLVGQQLTYEIMEVIVLWTASTWRPKFQFSWQALSQLYRFSLNLLAYKLLEFFNQRTDNLLIGYFLGEVALGYYAISHRILQVLTQLLIGTLNQVALPTFSRLQDNPKQFLSAFYQATQFTSLIAFPIFSAIILLSPQLVITLFGEHWRSAIPILQILPLTGIIRAVSFFQRSAFIAMGQPSIQMKLGLLNAIVNVIACLIALHWGILAVASAYVISDYLVFPLGQWLLSKLISLSCKTYLSQFLAPVTSTIIMVSVIFIIQQSLTSILSLQLNLIICCSIGFIVYTLSIKLLFPELFSHVFTLVALLRSSPQTNS
ncbi:lipopolysaccharide biosynthesis protein [Cronbergia sp. UHCC 0137]|uniref:lipopolysaccharide biosynthesis protein n=1 Tax=Cronbergia sp. UHCC 0137 TaxID=3110239 RepID=UPI002B212F70|nr:lipopolysaccharide biosynthesis protein [Cronbergia sp. UHCC 0137]MEA5619326.1 lipopolysaccharide biosynthesis protein [Cronbergia sp. UHCC 0137]